MSDSSSSEVDKGTQLAVLVLWTLFVHWLFSHTFAGATLVGQICVVPQRVCLQVEEVLETRQIRG